MYANRTHDNRPARYTFADKSRSNAPWKTGPRVRAFMVAWTLAAILVAWAIIHYGRVITAIATGV